ncbi:VOC family protein [Burkholderia mayonis]|uniref:Bleomycin resistance protein n=1 Tax=Burkholderia mayonis TaxID=1385591 RepID=A0A1B4FW09_9BURK|nr:VOC family protein [Burkholderia mayonis]AOJ07849.1 bleomycin resistance protein [Burkholderia mayonis]KVE50198.1 bleomycin resistance protein [Burkholderia mayonis]
MSAQLNHTIVWCRDKRRSTQFLTDILGLPEPVPFGPMLVVSLANGVSLDFYESDDPISTQHYAFLVGDGEFDRAFERIRERGLTYWADPAKRHAGEINTHSGGRGVYFDDPDGHFLELLTQPYDLGTGG